jgi:hypothetical protein
MEQSPSWEPNWSSASQTTRILGKPKVHYHIYKSLPPVSMQRPISPVYAPHSTYWRSILILFPIYAWAFQAVSFP